MKYRKSSSRPSHRPFPQERQKPFFPTSHNTVQAKEEPAFFQARLKVGQPGDKYEQEADAMAAAVVSGPSQSVVQQKQDFGIQRNMTAPEEEALQMQQEEEEELQMQEEEEEELQMQGEEEEELQMQEAPNGGRTASPQLSNRITSATGRGAPLPSETRAEMESSFGADFSNVNIHTGQESVEMNQGLGAQAFTHGKDVFFNAGKYNPESTEGKRLLAHELTHVVQQNGEEVQSKAEQ